MLVKTSVDYQKLLFSNFICFAFILSMFLLLYAKYNANNAIFLKHKDLRHKVAFAWQIKKLINKYIRL